MLAIPRSLSMLWTILLVTVVCTVQIISGANTVINPVEDVQIAFEVSAASISAVNGVYTCSSGGSPCLSANGVFQLASTHVAVGSTVQRRWYIHELVPDGINQKLFGAVEKSGKPWKVDRWKRLGNRINSSSNATKSSIELESALVVRQIFVGQLCREVKQVSEVSATSSFPGLLMDLRLLQSIQLLRKVLSIQKVNTDRVISASIESELSCLFSVVEQQLSERSTTAFQQNSNLSSADSGEVLAAVSWYRLLHLSKCEQEEYTSGPANTLMCKQFLTKLINAEPRRCPPNSESNICQTALQRDRENGSCLDFIQDNITIPRFPSSGLQCHLSSELTYEQVVVAAALCQQQYYTRRLAIEHLTYELDVTSAYNIAFEGLLELGNGPESDKNVAACYNNYQAEAGSLETYLSLVYLMGCIAGNCLAYLDSDSYDDEIVFYYLAVENTSENISTSRESKRYCFSRSTLKLVCKDLTTEVVELVGVEHSVVNIVQSLCHTVVSAESSRHRNDFKGSLRNANTLRALVPLQKLSDLNKIVVSLLLSAGAVRAAAFVFSKALINFAVLQETEHSSTENGFRSINDLHNKRMSLRDQYQRFSGRINVLETVCLNPILSSYSRNCTSLADIPSVNAAIEIANLLSFAFNSTESEGSSTSFEKTDSCDHADLFRMEILRSSLLRELTNSRMLSLAISILLQSTAPVILATPLAIEHGAPSWEVEVLALRVISAKTLALIRSSCFSFASVQDNSITQQCNLEDMHLNIGTRGLFLLAYQGLGLIVTPLQTLLGNATCVNDELAELKDYFISESFYRLTKDNNLHLPWNFVDNKSIYIGRENAVQESRKIRVAFLSVFLFRHSVGRLLANVIAGLDPAKFEVSIVTNGKNAKKEGDDITDFLRSKISEWIVLPSQIEIAVGLVRQQNYDLIVFGDVYMDTFVSQLAMFRMAKIQLSFWGHPFSSGSPAIDYFITSDSFEPRNPLHDRQGNYFEQLVRFDSLGFSLFEPEGREVAGQTDSVSISCVSRLEYLQKIMKLSFDIYSMPYYISPHTRQFREKLSSLSGTTLSEGVRTYGILQSLMKMHPLLDIVIIQILIKDPSAVILLLRNWKQFVWQKLFQERLLTVARRYKADIARVVFVPQMSHKDYARLLCSLDVSVDSIPFGGGVTLCDAVGGGCSTRTESTMNTTEKIVVNRRQVVPFVTCGSLQSVHQIGEGIASRIDSDYFARATEGNSSERDFCGSLKCIAGDVHSSTKHCIDALKCLVGSIKESHVKTIAEYVSTAIHVAEVSSNRSCVVDCIPCGLNNLQHEATSHTQFDRVFKLIHKNTDAIREWESFLRRIVV